MCFCTLPLKLRDLRRLTKDSEEEYSHRKNEKRIDFSLACHNITDRTQDVPSNDLL